MPFTARDVVRSLKKKGFVEDRKRDHVFLLHYRGGQKTGPYTKVSHGSGNEDIGDPLVRKMRCQLRLETSQQVRDLVECPMDGDAYIEHLISQQVIAR